MNYREILGRESNSARVRNSPFYQDPCVVIDIKSLPADSPLIGLANRVPEDTVAFHNNIPYLVARHNGVKTLVMLEEHHNSNIPVLKTPVLVPPQDTGKIITVRGTSGSGKTHAVRAIMGYYKNREAVYCEGRKRPLYYKLQHPSPGGRELVVLGSYESACGGCDSISGIDYTFSLVRELSPGRDLLFEGLLLSGECARTNRLAEDGFSVHAIYLTTPLEQCLASINARRAAKGKTEPVNPENTESKFKAVRNSIPRLSPLVSVYQCSRGEACATMVRLLGL